MMSNSYLHSVIFLSALALCPAAMAGTFTPPQGCTPEMTVQMLGCTVSNHFTCTGDAPGDRWRADFGQNGMFFRSRINAEAEWVESFDVNPDKRKLLEQPQRDPGNLTELLTTGKDSYDFSTLADDGERQNVTGFDKLTSETVVIDGVTLQRTQYDAKAVHDDGTPAWHTRGSEYVDAAHRVFLSGRGEWQGADGGDFLPFDFSPLDFAFSGEKGFMSTTPLFGCDEVLSQAAPSILISTRKGARP